MKLDVFSNSQLGCYTIGRFRDTSRILDLVTRDFGRVSVIARGVRSGKSRLKGVLRPFMPLEVSWVSRSELGTLTGAEVAGSLLTLSGDALLSGYYVNELLLHLMHRHDPQPEIYEAYGNVVRELATAQDLAPELRKFELLLLRLLGYEVNLAYDSISQQPLDTNRHYEYRAEDGPVFVERTTGPMVFSGLELSEIGRLNFASSATRASAKRLLRGVIAYHLDGRELKSRKVLREIRRADRAPDVDGRAD